jgi:hypothetical protein
MRHENYKRKAPPHIQATQGFGHTQSVLCLGRGGRGGVGSGMVDSLRRVLQRLASENKFAELRHDIWPMETRHVRRKPTRPHKIRVVLSIYDGTVAGKRWATCVAHFFPATIHCRARAGVCVFGWVMGGDIIVEKPWI